MSFSEQNSRFTTVPSIRINDIVKALRHPFNQAVALDLPSNQGILSAIKKNLSFPRNPDLAKLYHGNINGQTPRRFTGLSRFYDDLSFEDIKSEAEKGGVIIDKDAALQLSAACREAREMIRCLHRAYIGQDPLVTTRLLFAPRGGLGRSPMVHADNIVLGLHRSFNLSSLRIFDGELDPVNWNKIVYDRTVTPKWQLEFMEENASEFFNAPEGMPIILKGYEHLKPGQDESHRQQVCLHASSHLIPFYGQAAFMVYTTTP